MIFLQRVRESFHKSHSQETPGHLRFKGSRRPLTCATNALTINSLRVAFHKSQRGHSLAERLV